MTKTNKLRTISQLLILLIPAALLAVILFINSGKPYSSLQISVGEAEAIQQSRNEVSDLMDSLYLGQTALILDDSTNTFYYSVSRESLSDGMPKVKWDSAVGAEIAFVETDINEDFISSGATVDIIAYTDSEYEKYSLAISTLPFINITIDDDIGDDYEKVSASFYDNSTGETTCTEASARIRLRGASTKGLPKQNFTLALTKKNRDNELSLFGLSAGSSWVLYAGYNDTERIRNVFSMNLWNETCATDNAYSVNTGLEYKYVELFINGEYHGLYAICDKYDESTATSQSTPGNAYVYKVVNWTNEKSAMSFPGSYELKTSYTSPDDHIDDSDWYPLYEYYMQLSDSCKDNDALMNGIDIDNAIDYYLFTELLQCTDNVGGRRQKNVYLLMYDTSDGIKTLYMPWDLDNTWGISYSDGSTHLYGLSTDSNSYLGIGYFNQLMNNGDPELTLQYIEKYRTLRNGSWSDENISASIDGYERDIFGSGAYVRDIIKWPESSQIDPADKLSRFRSFVLERFHEMDLYIDRVEALMNESVFVRRSALYKNFLSYDFVVEFADYGSLTKDHLDLLEYIGIDTDSVPEGTHFISYSSESGRCSFYPDYVEGLDSLEHTAGQYKTFRVLLQKDGEEDVFDTSLGYSFHSDLTTFEDLKLYLNLLRYENSNAYICLRDRTILNDTSYSEALEKLNITGLTDTSEVILYDGTSKTGKAFGSADSVSVPGGAELFGSDIEIIVTDSATDEIIDHVGWNTESTVSTDGISCQLTGIIR